MNEQDAARVRVARWSELEDRRPTHARVGDVDLVIVRYDDRVSVLYGRCPHRGAPMSDATVTDRKLVCAAHCWDFDVETGISPTSSGDRLQKFQVWIDEERDAVLVDRTELEQWWRDKPQTFGADEYLGA